MSIGLRGDRKMRVSDIRRHYIGRVAIAFLIVIISFVVLMPIVLTILYSFEAPAWITHYFNQFNEKFPKQPIRTKVLPVSLSLGQYYNFLLQKPQYLKYMFNSLWYTSAIIIGQILVAPMAAFVFSKFRFRFINGLFFLYIVIMMLPFQAVMIPNYIALNNFGLLNTSWSLILPAIFSPFAVFLLCQYMKSVSDEILEAARIDGAGNFQLFTHIMMPLVKPGVAAMIVLSFAENWNMIEQPLLFINDYWLYPLSFILSNLDMASMNEVFAGAVIFMMPVVILFFIYHDDIISDIELFHIKNL
jgi:multiple sugar transport system permease protein